MAAIRRVLPELSDDELLAEIKRLAAAERRATVAVIRCLIELDARRLHLAQGCSSLFTFCTQVLHLSESAAYNRIVTARAARRFPIVVHALENGLLTLTAIRLLAPHLTDENHVAVLASAHHKSRTQIEKLIAALSPHSALSSVVRKLPERRPRPVIPPPSASTDASGRELAESPREMSLPLLPTIIGAAAPAIRKPAADAATMSTPAADARETAPQAFAPRSISRDAVTLAPELYRVHFTVTAETHDKLRRVQALLRHSIPSGDLSEIFDRAVTLLLDDVERRRNAAVALPRSPRPAAPGSRHIPAAVRREVWRRDEGRCAFVGRNGRCDERGFLEYHHVEPYAAGGAATAENIELRCRAHNAHEASLYFGRSSHELARETRVPVFGRWDAGARRARRCVHAGVVSAWST